LVAGGFLLRQPAEAFHCLPRIQLRVEAVGFDLHWRCVVFGLVDSAGFPFSVEEFMEPLSDTSVVLRSCEPYYNEVEAVCGGCITRSLKRQ
jgi:hypothetical protein